MTFPLGLSCDLPPEPDAACHRAPLEPFEMETVAPCVEVGVSLTKPAAMSSAF